MSQSDVLNPVGMLSAMTKPVAGDSAGRSRSIPVLSLQIRLVQGRVCAREPEGLSEGWLHDVGTTAAGLHPKRSQSGHI
jgi:hypothetical protein